MNRMIFDDSATQFPLSKTRMAEMQSDLQVPLKIMAMAMPIGDCILTGCGTAGEAGYVRVALPDGNGGNVYEVIEVKAGLSGGTYLNLQENTVYATTNSGERVAVRTERCLIWSMESSGLALKYADLPRLWVKAGHQDEEGYTGCANGTNWFVGTGGSAMAVRFEGGRVHLQGLLTYTPYIRVSEALMKTDYFKDYAVEVSEGALVRSTTATARYSDALVASEVRKAQELTFAYNRITLPVRYRPSGDVLIPIRYNGSPSTAIIDSDGCLLLAQDPEVGDILKVDTYFEI